MFIWDKSHTHEYVCEIIFKKILRKELTFFKKKVQKIIFLVKFYFITVHKVNVLIKISSEIQVSFRILLSVHIDRDEKAVT